MKFAAKKWWNYLIAVGIVAVLFACAYTPYKVTGGTDWPAKYICYFLTFAGVVVLGIGFISQDIYKAVIRHRINDWTNNLEDKYKNKAWMIFYPMFISGLFSIIVGIISNFFIK